MDLRVGTRVNVCDIFYFKGIKAAGEGGEREGEGARGKGWRGGRGRVGREKEEGEGKEEGGMNG